MKSESQAGWRAVKLRDVAEEVREFVLPSICGNMPYIALEHIAQGEPRLLDWSVASMAASAKATFRRGDLLFGKLRPNLAKSIIAPFDGVCSTDIVVLRPHADIMDPGFLLQLTHTPLFRTHAVRTAAGTKMPRTSWHLLSTLCFPLPTLPEQRKIAATLSSVDDVIQKTEAVIEQLRVVKRSMAQELLTRGVPGWHAQFKRTDVGEIPIGWAVYRLKDLLQGNPLNGVYKPPHLIGTGVLLLGMSAISDGAEITWGKCRRVVVEGKELEKYRLRKGDVLVTRVYARVDGVGRAIYVPDPPEDSLYESNMMRLRLRQLLVSPEFLVAYMDLPRMRSQIALRVTLGAQASVNSSQLGSLLLPVPSRAEQHQIIEVLASIQKSLEANRTELQRLREMKAALISGLLSGEIHVSLDPEPVIAGAAQGY